MKSIKYAISAVLAATALFVCGQETKIATREWVRKYVAAMKEEKAQVTTNVTWSGGVATTNYTFTSSFVDENNPDIEGITINVSYSITRTNSVQALMGPVRKSSSILSFLVPRAYADVTPWGDDGYMVSLEISGGTFMLTSTTEESFAFDPPQVFWWQNKLPMIPPDGTHVCDIPDASDCICLDAKKYAAAMDSSGGFPYPEGYELFTASDMNGDKGDIMNWTDLVNWPYQITTLGGKTNYMIPRADGSRSVNLKSIGQSMAWKEAVAGAFVEANEHIMKCRDAYRKLHLCLKVEPQHLWLEPAVEVGCANGMITYRKTCERNSDHQDEYTRPCPHENLGEKNYYQTDEQWMYYEQLCLKTGCGGKVLGKDPRPPEGLECTTDSHIPLALAATNGVATSCGCICGHYNSSNPGPSDTFHSWASGANCLCRCGKFHVGVEASTAQKNDHTWCPQICAGEDCDGQYRYNANGLVSTLPKAGAADHASNRGYNQFCGCWCQKFHPGDDLGTQEIERFHVRMPGDCRCYGAAGPGRTAGTGGTWHFASEANANCKKLCNGTWGGVFDNPREHLAEPTTRSIAGTPDAAEPKDHTRNTSSCGCKCGDMSSSTLEEWRNVKELHKWQTGHCACVCGMSPVHEAIPDPLCDNICRGYESTHQRTVGQKQCPRTVSGIVANGNIKYSHTPKEDGCGCLCGEFSASAYSGTSAYDSMFHNGTGSPGCWCTCGKTSNCGWHTFAYGNECSRICNTCKATTTQGLRHKSEVKDVAEGDHTPKTNHCGCVCGELTVAKGNITMAKFHPIKPDTCACYDITKQNHDKHRKLSHTTTDTVVGSGASFTCRSCGNTIGRERHKVACKVNGDSCWYYPVYYYVETGHAPDCGAPPEPSDDENVENEPVEDPATDSTCPNCGRIYSSNYSECPYCGDTNSSTGEGDSSGNTSGENQGGGSGGGSGSSLDI